ncbi:MAG: hypothetical protein ACW99U_09430 [Candidatus Thorarchaeota archaeon]|jgi:hypothetical protein
MKNETSFVLCMIAGVMLITVNSVGGLVPLFLVYILLHSIPALSAIFWIMDLFLLVLYVIALLGGAGVIIGGLLLTTSWVRTGKFIVSLAAGFGLLSLIITILQTWIAFGLAGLMVLTYIALNSTWATAIILTIIARWKARA